MWCYGVLVRRRMCSSRFWGSAVMLLEMKFALTCFDFGIYPGVGGSTLSWVWRKLPSANVHTKAMPISHFKPRTLLVSLTARLAYSPDCPMHPRHSNATNSIAHGTLDAGRRQNSQLYDHRGQLFDQVLSSQSDITTCSYTWQHILVRASSGCIAPPVEALY